MLFEITIFNNYYVFFVYYVFVMCFIILMSLTSGTLPPGRVCQAVLDNVWTFADGLANWQIPLIRGLTIRRVLKNIRLTLYICIYCIVRLVIYHCFSDILYSLNPYYTLHVFHSCSLFKSSNLVFTGKLMVSMLYY